MNERIEKLARQVEAAYIPRYDMWQMDSETVQKFVELIVKECANLCQCEWNGDADTHDSCEAYNECADMILEHFGVEE